MPRARCVNPVFVQWLEDLRDGEEKDSNRYWAYAKAAKAMKQHPDVLNHPSECIQIKGIGAKIVQALTARHIEANGGVDLGGDGTTVVKSTKKTTAKSSSSSSSSRTQPKKRGRKPQQASSSDADDPPASAPAPPKVGGVAFINHTVHANGIVVVNRTTAAAVPAPAPARPARPATQAVHARQARANVEDIYDELFANRGPAVGATYPAPDPMQPPAPQACFPFFYLDEHGRHTRSRDDAVKDIMVTGLYHKIEYPAHAHSHALVMAGMIIQATAKSERGTFWAFIADDASHEYDVCPGFELPAAPPPAPAPSRQNSMSNLAAEAAMRRLSGTHIPSSPAQPVASSSRAAVLTRTQTLPAIPATSASRAQAAPPARTQTMPAPNPTPAARAQTGGSSKNRRPRLSAQMPIPRFDGGGLRIDASCIGLDGMDELAREFPTFSPLVLPWGTYEVVLLLDMREDRAGGDRMIEGLMALGVNCKRRTLELGDVLWMACRTHKMGDEYDEIALDFIVERKRMDDLIQSLKDSRYHDQKFRLHCSAMSHIYYVVEGYNEERHMRDYGQQIATVVSSTQVVDGFMVKETSALKDTIRYLSNLHDAIIDYYKNRPIHVIPSAHVKPYSYVALQKHLREIRHPGTPIHVSLNAFQSTNSKRGHVTASEAWARMLLGVNQMSAAKVAAVRAEYEGPAQLRRAFRVAEAEEARQLAHPPEKKGRGKPKVAKAEHMLAAPGAKGRDKIGPALSARLYRLMRAQRYDNQADAGSSDDDD
ncbi:hypothetical protein AURDEDRAFT_187031 [Auricularia subglabra TFB-10046 SS5]|nr:hypothetical protein AURDEDRAFT_187031 [Auricularia subglabra TFB-10046 SS5]